MRAIVLALLAPLVGCTTVIINPTQPQPRYVRGPAYVVPVAVTTKSKPHHHVIYVKAHRGICAYQNPDGSLSFTDRCPVVFE